MVIFAHLNSYSLQRTKMLGTPTHMRVLPGGTRRGEGGGGGREWGREREREIL